MSKEISKDVDNEKAKELGLSHRKGHIVHAGLAVKGGAGYRGTVEKIDDEYTWINIGKGKYGNRIVKAPHKLVTKEEIDRKKDDDLDRQHRKNEKMKKIIDENTSEKDILSELSIKTLQSYQNKVQFKPERVKGFYKAEKIIKDKKNPVDNPKIHDLTHMHDDGDVYDHTQTSEHINDGDILKLHGGRTALMYSAWPTMVKGKSDALHHLKDGKNFEMPRYKKSLDLEKTINKVNEEHLNELSTNTLNSYVKKAQKSSDKLWKKVDGEEDKAMSTDGEKYPDKQNKHIQIAKTLTKKAQNRDKGIVKAKDLVSILINKFKK